MEGEPQQCFADVTQCKPGFQCQRTSTGPSVCCSIGGATGNIPVLTVSHARLSVFFSACRPDQVSVGGICLDRSEPNQPCINPAQCLGGSTCTNGKEARRVSSRNRILLLIGVCACPPSTVLVGNICKQAGATGGERYISITVSRGTFVVIGCSSNQIFLNGECLSTAEIGQACVSTAQCLGQSQCSGGFCACAPGQIVKDNVCINGPSGTGIQQSMLNDRINVSIIKISIRRVRRRLAAVLDEWLAADLHRNWLSSRLLVSLLGHRAQLLLLLGYWRRYWRE